MPQEAGDATTGNPAATFANGVGRGGTQLAPRELFA